MTEATAEADGLIKQDQRGRMRVTRERRQMLVAEFESSSMTGRQFAMLAGIKPTTFQLGAEVAKATGGATAGSGCGKRAGSAVAGGGGGKARSETGEENGDAADRAWAAWRAPGAGRGKSDQAGRAIIARTWAGA